MNEIIMAHKLRKATLNDVYNFKDEVYPGEYVEDTRGVEHDKNMPGELRRVLQT